LEGEQEGLELLKAGHVLLSVKQAAHYPDRLVEVEFENIYRQLSCRGRVAELVPAARSDYRPARLRILSPLVEFVRALAHLFADVSSLRLNAAELLSPPLQLEHFLYGADELAELPVAPLLHRRAGDKAFEGLLLREVVGLLCDLEAGE
jgi:hypothetical protein